MDIFIFAQNDGDISHRFDPGLKMSGIAQTIPLNHLLDQALCRSLLTLSLLSSMNVAVFRKAHFNAAHRLHNPAWSDERNKEVFGLCNNPHYHGHNYELEVKIVGKIDPETGMVVDLGWLASLIKQEIELRFDHKNLNIDTVEFRDLNPTAENIALVIWQILRAQVPEQLELGVRLYETPRNFVEVG